MKSFKLPCLALAASLTLTPLAPGFLTAAQAAKYTPHKKENAADAAAGESDSKSAPASGTTGSAANTSNISIPDDIAALWRSPSPAFTQAFAKVGEESREASMDKVRKFLASGPNAAESRAASYALARLLTRGKNNQPSVDDRKEAMDLFDKAAAMPCLHMSSLWHISELTSPIGDENATRAILSKISADGATSGSDRARAQYELAQSLMRTPTDGNPAQAADPSTAQAKSIFLSIKEKYPSTEYATGSSYYLGQIAAAEAGQGQPTPAPLPPQTVAYWKDYLKNSTSGRFSSEVADKLYALSQDGSVTLSTDDYGQIASVFYKRGDLTKALGAYDKMGPEAKLFQRAQCLSKTGHLKEAEAALLAGIKKDPTSASYDDYVTTLCAPLNRQDSAALWRKVLALNPKHADHALYNVAIRVEDAEAMPLLNKLLQQYPTSEHAPETLWWVFWHQAKNLYPNNVAKEKARALALCKLASEGAVRYSNHRVAARLYFWAGKIHEKLGQTELAKQQYEQAKEKYPTNYYGSRARARLQYMAATGEKKHDRGFSTSAGRQLKPESWHWPQPPQLFSFDKVAPLVGAQAMVLAVTHQGDEAVTKVDAAIDTYKTGPDRVALDCLKSWLYLCNSMPMEGIRAASRDLEGYPTRAPRWQIYYPWAYCEAINDAAAKNNVDPFLVHALIREESRYFPMALSRSKAIGLMQLMPGTGFGVAKRIGLHISSQDEIFNPDNNIKMGTNYLAYTLSRFDGMAMLAVASYNGGPNAVKHWVDVFHGQGGSDWDIFVENIPFRETRDYVRKVFGSYWVYELMYQ